MLHRKDLNSAKLEIVRVSEVLRRLLQPTAKCKQKKKRPCTSKNWIYSLQEGFSMIHWLFSENSAEYSYERTSSQKPQPIKGGRRKNATRRTAFRSLSLVHLPAQYCSKAVPALHPASKRSESTSSTARGDPLHEPAATKKHKNGGTKQYGETVARSARMVKNSQKILWMKGF